MLGGGGSAEAHSPDRGLQGGRGTKEALSFIFHWRQRCPVSKRTACPATSRSTVLNRMRESGRHNRVPAQPPGLSLTCGDPSKALRVNTTEPLPGSFGLRAAATRMAEKSRPFWGASSCWLSRDSTWRGLGPAYRHHWREKRGAAAAASRKVLWRNAVAKAARLRSEATIIAASGDSPSLARRARWARALGGSEGRKAGGFAFFFFLPRRGVRLPQ